MPYDTEKDNKKLNNFSAQKSCLFPSCKFKIFIEQNNLVSLTLKKKVLIIYFILTKIKNTKL